MIPILSSCTTPSHNLASRSPKLTETQPTKSWLRALPRKTQVLLGQAPGCSQRH